MGGRLAGSTVGGGIVTPFTYYPQQQEMTNAYPAAAPLRERGTGLIVTHEARRRGRRWV
jgi:hypothetical protein